MKKAVWRPVVLAAALAVLPLMAASAEAGAPEPLSADVVAAMTPEQQGEVLEPLRVVADAAARAGRGAQADVYTQVEMAPDYRSVNLYLTDPGRRAAFVDAVREVNPKADTELLHVRRSAKSRQQLRKEMTALVSRKDLPFKVEMASSTVDGGAIDLGVDDAKAAREYLARPAVAKQLTQAGATPVRVRQSPAMVPLSGRWDDTSPFYAGAALGPATGSRAHCTSGIPAVSTVDSRRWLVTAGHCYGQGEVVFTAGGNRVGPVGAEIADLDSAFIETGTSPYTWDGTDAQGYTRRLNSVRNVAVGDFVCQLGYGSKVVCNIRTTHSGDATWVTEGAHIFGSAGVPHNGGVVARTGDSGGPVITINDPNSRQLNGMVVAGFGCTIIDGEKVCSSDIGWIEVLDIFDRFALALAP
ncbi:S1 family peptidase [Streptomyces sp. SKN60]|uniref:trypsin-like serine protease n=1 Tax=Streptomyces sp. SKN60 TaxID=2855506 RepID=UPI0022450DB6|nr:trypsin-like serine protease [Streptomyces sp. SKN60]MCX2184091.1 S1 family peptidase [Streptomyces sp. SKN60]